MTRRILIAAAVLFFALSPVCHADSIRIPLPPMPPLPPPPPAPHIEREPPRTHAPEVVVVAPPPPPFIKFEVAYPDIWFYDDHRGEWFYYEKRHKKRYVKRHVWHDDGRHYYGHDRSWHKSDRAHAEKKGWYKHKKKEERRHRKKW